MTNDSFETFLQDYFADHSSTILDDDIPDAFDEWIGDIDSAELIDLAEDWGKKNRKAIAEKIAEPLNKALSSIKCELLSPEGRQACLTSGIAEALSIANSIIEGKE